MATRVMAAKCNPDGKQQFLNTESCCEWSYCVASGQLYTSEAKQTRSQASLWTSH